VKKIALLCILSGVAGAILAVGLQRAPDPEQKTVAQEPAPSPAAAPSGPKVPGPATPTAPPGADEFTPEERVNIEVYEKVNRSVVHITTRGFQADRFLMIETPSEGEGSGMVLDRQGHILTNYHVIDGARQIQVALFDGNSYEAKLVGSDPTTDTAILQISAPADSLFPVVFGNSTHLKVGQRVYAIGNPFGLERTLATGIISSLNRSLPSRRNGRSIKSIIQIDAAINPGNSGGPLLDSHGRLIGMNTAIASKTGESAGVGFAIPINTIARIAPQLIAGGRIRRPDAGIGRVYETDKGLLVATLVPGGAAEKAGLRGPKVIRQQKRQGAIVYEYQTVDRAAADLIVAVDGKSVKSGDDFLDAIENKKAGDQVTLTVVREGQQRQVPVTLEAGE
jgi:S1-C subfamily serine protease